MVARMAVAVLLGCVASSAAIAQRDTRPRFPAEKFSTRPVQPQMKVAPVAGELKDEQKRRWEKRSRGPAAPAR